MDEVAPSSKAPLSLEGAPTPSRLRLLRAVSPLLGLGLLASCASLGGGGPRSGPSLEQQIDAIVSAPPLDQVHWGILVVDPERDEVLYTQNAHRKFVPASNMKILSTATALSLLGPEFRYETGLWAVGTLNRANGRLEGDLVLRPSGDPTLSARFYPSAHAPLDSLADRLWATGVREVTGTLVVDASAWDSTTVPGSWMVANLPGTSAATGGAFALAEGELSLEIRGGRRPGAPAQVRWWPEGDSAFVSAQFVTGEEGRTQRTVDYLPESRRLVVQGSVPAEEVDTLQVSQRDPVRLASQVLLKRLERRGIRVEGGVHIVWSRGEPLGSGDCVTGPEAPAGAPGGREEDREGATPPPGPTLALCPGATRLTYLASPPMAEIVEAILEPSQNWMTEQLVRTLGAELGREGSWDEGFEVEEGFLTGAVGVDTLDLSFRDGSGLSAYNLVTPRAVVRILDYMRSSTQGQTYRLALAEPGEDPGTLRSRLTALEGRVFAKTGTITHVNSLSGYLVTDSGRELIFSILTNGSGLPSGIVRGAIDQVVEAVARR